MYTHDIRQGRKEKDIEIQFHFQVITFFFLRSVNPTTELIFLHCVMRLKNVKVRNQFRFTFNLKDACMQKECNRFIKKGYLTYLD